MSRLPAECSAQRLPFPSALGTHSAALGTSQQPVPDRGSGRKGSFCGRPPAEPWRSQDSTVTAAGPAAAVSLKDDKSGLEGGPRPPLTWFLICRCIRSLFTWRASNAAFCMALCNETAVSRAGLAPGGRQTTAERTVPRARRGARACSAVGFSVV